MNSENVYAVVVAGGVGSRMGIREKPKQYLEIGGKPIIIHTLDRFCSVDRLKKYIVLCPKEWIEYTRELVDKYLGEYKDKIVVIEGGSTRNETIMNSIRYIEETDGLGDDTIIVTHDSVRPFVTKEVIEENIRYALEVGACDTAAPATDTIVISEDNDLISDIPDRTKMYQGQTPQTFNAKKLRDLYESLTDDEKEVLTDASKIFVMKGEKVHIVEGDISNIKITYPYDLIVAEALLKEVYADA